MKKTIEQTLLESLSKNLTNLWEDWNKVNHHDKTNGLSQKAVNAYRREHPGSKLKTAVTTKPSKLKPGSKAAKRRKSFCARMSGNKGPMKKPNGKPTPKALALRRWNCESIEEMRHLIEHAEQEIAREKILQEKWTKKYKSSINCSHPKGFSQKAHCAGKKKHNESMMTMEAICPDCGMCQTHGSLNEIAKGAKDSNGFTKCWPGKHAEGTKKGRNGGRVRNCVPNESQGVAEGAPELLKKEMPLHRHAEKLLAQNGVSKDDPDYHHHLNNTIKHLRQFGNIDLINKSDEQGVSEGSEQYDEISDKAFDDGYAGYSYRNVYPKGTREYEEYHEGWYDGRLAFEKANDYESDFYISRPEQGVAEVAGAQKCWPGYRKTGTQPGTGKNAGKRVNDCEKIKEDEVDEAAKHGLYYNVNKRKKAGTSRPASSPKAPTAQAWRDAAKTAKTEGAGAQQAAIAIAKKESGNYTKTGQRKK
jgi:hypothetical protein